MSSELPYRPNVCMLLFNTEKKLWFGERTGEPGVWQFPQGGVQDGEKLEKTVVEELHEELGAPREVFSIASKLFATHQYDFTRPPEYAKDKWRGQSQTFWVVEFLGKDSDINTGRFQPEFDSWKWCTPEEVRALAEPKRLPGYEAPLREFEELMKLRGVPKV